VDLWLPHKMRFSLYYIIIIVVIIIIVITIIIVIVALQYLEETSW